MTAIQTKRAKNLILVHEHHEIEMLEHKGEVEEKHAELIKNIIDDEIFKIRVFDVVPEQVDPTEELL